jgi:CheY-like chemotaxis protein
LEAEHYQVITAKNGAEGLSKATSEAPTLILLDVMMAHETEGFDVVRHLKDEQKTRSIPIVIITGIRKKKKLPFKFEPDEEWLPVKAVIEKPIKPDELIKLVKEVAGS